MAFSVSPTCCANHTNSMNFTSADNNISLVLDRSSYSDPNFYYIAIVICSVGLILNVIEITILMKTWRMLSIFEIWLLNLAVSDGVVALGILVYETIRFKATSVSETFSDVMTTAASFIIHFSMSASCATITLIGIDRLLAIK